MVREFHEVFDVSHAHGPRPIDPETMALRKSLIDEETRELYEAMGGEDWRDVDLAHIAKELADLLYVVYGTAVTYGIEIGPVFAEVHRSNMDKAPGGIVTKRGDGKVLKPEGWKAPDIARVIAAQSNL
ncbi:MAG: MazG nucleotide pyrophosphohydrolase domain-containing protein [Dehalococcoidia bacterium]